MRRFYPPMMAGVALAATACGDAIAPTRSADFEVVSGNVTVAAAKKDKDPKPSDGTQTYTATFVIPAAGGEVRVGDFTLHFAPSSVCNPLTSGYGQKYWERSCSTLATDFPMTAMFWWENGEAFVDFLTDIRFDPSKLVYISTVRPDLYGRNANSGVGKYQILYWRHNGKDRITVDEAGMDKGLKEFIDPSTGRVYRRIKHFSGYSVSSGAPCNDTLGDPDCVATNW